MTRIPLAVPDLGELEEAYVLDAVRSTWIGSSGIYVDRFEREFADMAGAAEAIGVCNGTVALHVALLALDLRPGDEVLVPSLTYVATANAVRYVGAEPVFVDIDPDTWCIDPELLERSITRRTKGIIAVDLYGHPCDYDTINRIAAIHGLWVVEDAAEAHSARYKGRPAGGLARVGTFSFFGNKILTSGEGGALTVSEPNLALRIRTLKGQGVDPQRRYFFPVTGYNFRLTNVACAFLCAQIERKEELLSSRRAVFAKYAELLAGIPGIGFQPVASWASPAPWLFCITVDARTFGRTRDELIAFLDDHGVETRPFFIPLHTLPPFRQESAARGTDLPITGDVASRGINLPTHARLTADDIAYIARTIASFRV